MLDRAAEKRHALHFMWNPAQLNRSVDKTSTKYQIQEVDYPEAYEAGTGGHWHPMTEITDMTQSDWKLTHNNIHGLNKAWMEINKMGHRKRYFRLVKLDQCRGASQPGEAVEYNYILSAEDMHQVQGFKVADSASVSGGTAIRLEWFAPTSIFIQGYYVFATANGVKVQLAKIVDPVRRGIRITEKDANTP